VPVEVSIEGGPPLDPDAVEADAAQLLEALGLGASELSIVLADDAFVEALNAEWRGVHHATDVLSFPQEEPVEPGRFSVPPTVLGDVVISAETAARQAADLGHPLATEVRVLLVHGLLHLVGHDHEASPDAARQMRREEARLAAVLGIDPAVALVERNR
jgi:rRNA maturation RNase YbeY